MASLKSLSDKELLAETLKLRRREHKTTLEILVHLNEIERRRLYLKLGYSSLFDYCTRHLKYSASAAGRRVQAAKCARRHPEVYELLEKEKVNLMTVALVAGILNDDNKREILGAIQDKTQREVEAIASRYRPPVVLRDRVSHVRVCVPDHSLSRGELSTSSERDGSELSLVPPGSPNEISPGSRAPSGQIPPAKSANSQCGSEKSTTYAGNGGELPLDKSRSAREPANGPHARIEQKLLIRFLADEAFMKKYEQVRSLLSQRLPDTSFACVFDALISEFLERRSPENRRARRDKRKMRRERIDKRERQEQQEKQAQSTAKPPQKTPPRRHQPASRHRNVSQDQSRYIPATVRDEVFMRDKGRCTYMGKTGERCGSTQALQIDHIVPFARGGPATASNLRLLCAKHNRLAAEEALGEAFMGQYRKRDERAHQRE